MSTHSHRTQPEIITHRNEGRVAETRDPFEPLLNTDEAARLLRMHSRTLRIKARNGEIPAIQVGRRWRFRASALNRWLEQSQPQAAVCIHEGGSTTERNRGMLLAKSADTV